MPVKTTVAMTGASQVPNLRWMRRSMGTESRRPTA